MLGNYKPIDSAFSHLAVKGLNECSLWSSRVVFHVFNPPSAKYQYISPPLNQYNDYIFRFLTKRASIQVPTSLVENKLSREKKCVDQEISAVRFGSIAH